MQPSPSQGQRLLYLASDHYTWFTIAPKTFIVPADPDDTTHYANVVHITQGWKGPIAPLCKGFESELYYQRRLLTPVMDASNVCTPCVTALDQRQSHALARGGAAFLANGRLIQRGDPAADQVVTLRAAFEQLVVGLRDLEMQRQAALRALEQRHQTDLVALFQHLGVPHDLLPPTEPVALPPPHVADEVPIIFSHDDPGYTDWRTAHRADGYVANGDRSGFIVHHADCRELEKTWSDESATFLTETHVKICATSLSRVRDAAERIAIKAHVKPGHCCTPYTE